MDSQTTAQPSLGGGPDVEGRGRSRVQRWIEILVLSSFAFSQPLLSTIGENATFLVAHEVSDWGLVGFAVALILVPALFLVALDEILLVSTGGAYRVTGIALRAFLLGLVVAPTLNSAIGLDGWPSLLVIVAMWGVGYLSLSRLPVLLTVVRFAVVAPLVFLAWFLLLTPASALLGSGEEAGISSAASSENSVVWLVFDQFPLSLMIEADGSLSSSRFPNFNRLAETSTWYPNATTVASATGIAVPSSLSGTYVDSDSLPVVSDVPVNLFTLLGRTHQIEAHETFTQLCPDSLCEAHSGSTESRVPSVWYDTFVVMVRVLLVDGVADMLVPETNDRWAGFGDDGLGEFDLTVDGEVTDRADLRDNRREADDRPVSEAFLAELAASTGPTVHYLHIEKPHEPLILLPDGRAYDHCSCYRVDREGHWPVEPEMATQRLQRYLMQAVYVDTFLGQVQRAMEVSGLDERAILVVMSDHGVSLLPGSKNRKIDADNVHDILPVPMFVRRPGQSEPLVDRREVQLIDLLPTVLDELGMPTSDLDLDGDSLLDSSTGGRPPALITGEGLMSPPELPNAVESDLPAWVEGLFPEPFNPFRWGPDANLFGVRAASMVIGESDLTASLATDDQIENGAEDGYVPAHVIGELDGSDQSVTLAVAVNGTIAGTGSTFFKDVWRISVMIDPSTLEAEDIEIELFEVVEAGLLRIGTA